ncbi:MAG: hypothetical protein IJG39_10305 [Synergistaceae bacterium]|nr:hypothetical protein [Synergistaceae bacterium]
MTKQTVAQAIEAIEAMNGTNTADEVYAVLMSLTKAGINDVYMAVTGDAGLPKSWKKEELACWSAQCISGKKADAAFLAMEVMEKVGYLGARTEQSRRAPVQKCSLYELVVIAKELGVSAEELRRVQEELCPNKIYWGYGLAMALYGVIRRSLYEGGEPSEKSEVKGSARRLSAERKDEAKTSRLKRKYAGEMDWIQRVYRDAMEYSRDYEIPGYEVTAQDKVEHFLFNGEGEFEASIDYARALALRPSGERGYDWDIGDYASELIPRIADIVARIGASLAEAETETMKEESPMTKAGEAKTSDSAMRKIAVMNSAGDANDITRFVAMTKVLRGYTLAVLKEISEENGYCIKATGLRKEDYAQEVAQAAIRTMDFIDDGGHEYRSTPIGELRREYLDGKLTYVESDIRDEGVIEYCDKLFGKGLSGQELLDVDSCRILYELITSTPDTHAFRNLSEEQQSMMRGFTSQYNDRGIKSGLSAIFCNDLNMVEVEDPALAALCFAEYIRRKFERLYHAESEPAPVSQPAPEAPASKDAPAPESSEPPATLIDVCAGVENYDCGKLTAEELEEILSNAPAETLREYILNVIIPEKERKDAA